jgi:hypothetical protein
MLTVPKAKLICPSLMGRVAVVTGAFSEIRSRNRALSGREHSDGGGERQEWRQGGPSGSRQWPHRVWANFRFAVIQTGAVRRPQVVVPLYDQCLPGEW